ncbi:hypothetical protein CDAR_222041 [Caerostris darwini]|uniref:Uncharacterized protein n=1 Tax=Caerostris darwini TaxID=1538125 RepID=A0AAV4V170_9ARAC|nr:hypothetical protein CDAR_222041 [Caerostris darwini]
MGRGTVPTEELFPVPITFCPLHQSTCQLLASSPPDRDETLKSVTGGEGSPLPRLLHSPFKNSNADLHIKNGASKVYGGAFRKPNSSVVITRSNLSSSKHIGNQEIENKLFGSQHESPISDLMENPSGDWEPPPPTASGHGPLISPLLFLRRKTGFYPEQLWINSPPHQFWKIITFRSKIHQSRGTEILGARFCRIGGLDF